MDETINEEETKILSKHVDTCTDCKESFLIYDQMMRNFDDSIIEAPEGLEDAVMAEIRTMPEPINASKQDNIIYIIWGLLSALFGVGFLVAFNSESILNFMSTSENLQTYYNTITPLSSVVEKFFASLISSIYTVVSGLQQFTANNYPLLVVGVIIFAAVQIILIKRHTDKNKTSDNE